MKLSFVVSRLRRTGGVDGGRGVKGRIWPGSSHVATFVTVFAICFGRQVPALADQAEDHFEAKIRPVLLTVCFDCHGELKSGGTLRVDSRESLLRGGESGPAVIPGQPEASLLIQAIQRHEGVSAMPPDKEKRLRPDQIADFVSWVSNGAVWPAGSARFESVQHWAFQPVEAPVPPAVQDEGWIRSDLDRFIRARQEALGVVPAKPASRLSLIRRITYDLTGLPPKPEEIDAFEQDESPTALETVVDRLLDSPAYGERWGRHWLDVVRYADTAGETADYPVTDAWRYRNYVVSSFNADKPYDEFLREQIAGDILAVKGSADRYSDRVTATGYLAVSRRFGFDSENYHHLTIQDTIDNLGQTVLGLTLGCARCHDHKFDPISIQDYYALYGIFDSSRYAFPGSEQKQKVRAMVPLLPPTESIPQWRAYDARVGAITASLERQKQAVPSAILRSLNDLDGDFELQAAAAGGSNGVLVPPWLYSGKIAVTNAAQSPFKNLFSRGRVGASISAGAGEYKISQALYPQRTSQNCDVLHVNLDFRIALPDWSFPGTHRFWVGAHPDAPAAEVLISSESVMLRQGNEYEVITPVIPSAESGAAASSRWYNVQLTLDLRSGTVSGAVGYPGAVSEFSGKRLSPAAEGVINFVQFDTNGNSGSVIPMIEFDNLGVQESPIAPVSTEIPSSADQKEGVDPVALAKELETLTGFDGDFELQTLEAAPATPWGPGPNSVVVLKKESQSPFLNSYQPGELGIHLPNRAEYDGFARSLTQVKISADGKLYASFDFRCASTERGGDGSWRYYLGHGPGNSAAIELFFNGREFFRRSADAREPVCSLVVGEWYQVQLTLDVNNRSFVGQLLSRRQSVPFNGEFASGWDGTIDYTFIDSYGHLGGVRPALDADNFVLSDMPLSSLDVPSSIPQSDSKEARRTRLKEIRQQLAATQADAEISRQELNRLLAEGPCAMTYGMAEGTPHNVRIQVRGEPDQPGAEVPRGFLKVLGGESLPPGTSGSGRWELAQWLTRPDNPLTARVMVNRIWQYHFGRGLVKTPNDFGLRGMRPTHPELLDFLATQFVREGWSIKRMHKHILLSATYQQSTIPEPVPATATAPADTRDLYVSFSRRRLSAEEIRDSILFVSGELDPAPAQGHPFPTPINWGYSQHGPFSAVYEHNKRSIYLMTQRLKRHPFLALFDGADPNASTAERLGTTVPTQALFFLNDPFLHTKSEKLASRLLSRSSQIEEQINLASQLTVGRSPTATEGAEAIQFVQEYGAELASLGQQENAELKRLAAYLRTLFGSNEFLHLD
ncbi:PSD1 and planctomycete cytochrome C domain-containing protein [Schlesneria sp. T3-172]|uniref:PSD1 and planctomycete cytochrome C domain-containing protein n=1 Tax=Schlesneria sphaerica TaxID=3373610 RepID=UPI0037C6997D